MKCIFFCDCICFFYTHSPELSSFVFLDSLKVKSISITNNKRRKVQLKKNRMVSVSIIKITFKKWRTMHRTNKINDVACALFFRSIAFVRQSRFPSSIACSPSHTDIDRSHTKRTRLRPSLAGSTLHTRKSEGDRMGIYCGFATCQHTSVGQSKLPTLHMELGDAIVLDAEQYGGHS